MPETQPLESAPHSCASPDRLGLGTSPGVLTRPLATWGEAAEGLALDWLAQPCCRALSIPPQTASWNPGPRKR